MERTLKEGSLYVIQGTRNVRSKGLGKKGTLSQFETRYEFVAKDDDKARKIYKDYTKSLASGSTKVTYDTELFKLTAVRLA